VLKRIYGSSAVAAALLSGAARRHLLPLLGAQYPPEGDLDALSRSHPGNAAFALSINNTETKQSSTKLMLILNFIYFR
jgi:hypothetical protein